MAVELQITLDDQDYQRLARQLAGLGSATISLALYELGESVRNMAIDAFGASASPEGVPWKPSQRALRESGKTLVDTGILQNSISVALGSGEVEVGSNIVYAAIHQLGGKAGRGRKVTLPARPFLPDVRGELLRREAMDILKGHIERALS